MSIRRPILISSALGVVLLGGLLSAAWWQLAAASNRLLDDSALLAAESYVRTIESVRSVYTSEVVARVPEGVSVTHDYLVIDGAIPLPATLTIQLAEEIGRSVEGLTARLYSAYPFPWRAESSGLDEFETRALRDLERNPSQSYHEFTEVDGERILRYARADRMRSDCVLCHNTHPDSPKRDWEVGDVRGVLEISMPVRRVETTPASAQSTLAIVFLFGSLSLILAGGLAIQRIPSLARTAELRALNEELTRTSRAKDEFLAVMSHELRTPLGAVLGLSESLEEGVYGPMLPEQSEAIQGISLSGHRLLSLINEILDFAKVQSGTISLTLASVALEEVVNLSIRLVEAAAKDSGVTIIWDAGSEVTTLRTDEQRLSQILVNLVMNAVKFTPKGGEVGLEVHTSAESKEVRCVVWDTGIGIAPEDMDLLFEPFQQLDTGLNRTYDGTGLGLSLARKLAGRLGGDLQVTSPGLGKGSRFTLTLPWEPPTESAAKTGDDELETSSRLIVLAENDEANEVP